MSFFAVSTRSTILMSQASATGDMPKMISLSLCMYLYVLYYLCICPDNPIAPPQDIPPKIKDGSNLATWIHAFGLILTS